MIKLVQLFYEIKVTRIIVETINQLGKPFINLFGVLFTIFYVFGVMGMFFFGGLVYKKSPLII